MLSTARRNGLNSFRVITRSKTVSVIPIPLSFGQPLLGPDRAPSLLVEYGLHKTIANCGYQVNQLPTVVRHMEPSSEDDKFSARNVSIIGSTCKNVMEQVKAESATKNFLLMLGGDHSIPIGTIPGILSHRPDTGIVWVDAHADINTPETSPSGNMHGMPVAFLLGLVKNASKMPHMDWFRPCLRPEDIVYIGLRDLDAGEKKIIKQLGIKAFTMYEVDRYGIGKVMDECIAHLKHKKNIHLSYDIDGLDPFYAPSTGTAVRGGLTFREGNFICEALAETGKLTSMELVEVNPSLKSEMDAKDTIDMSLMLIASSLGLRIL